VGFIGLCWLLFRHRFQYSESHARAVMDLRPGDTITDRRLLARCLVVLGLVTVGFSLHSVLHLQPSLIALLGAGTMILVSRTTPVEFLEEVEWPTLVFFMALFVLVGGLVNVGVIRLAGPGRDRGHRRSVLPRRDRPPVRLGGTGSVRRQHPVHGDDGAHRRGPGERRTHRRDGRVALVGLRAGGGPGRQHHRGRGRRHVVIIGIAARHLHPVSFWEFMKYGLVVTVFTLLIAWPYIWLRYFAFG